MNSGRRRDVEKDCVKITYRADLCTSFPLNYEVPLIQAGTTHGVTWVEIDAQDKNKSLTLQLMK